MLSNETKSQSAYKKITYSAYIKGDMQTWVKVIHTMQINEDAKSIDQKLELTSYYYGYIGYLIGLKNNNTAETYINQGEQIIDKTLLLQPNNATALAFKGSFIAFRIGLNKFKAITLGPQSAAYIQNSLKLEPNNIQANIDYANELYYKPGILGGDKKSAIIYYSKAISLMEKSDNIRFNWLYLNTLALLGKAYENTAEIIKAKATYEKALKAEPDFNWIKNELYPKILKNEKSQY